MALEDQDIISFTDTQTLDGKKIINIFYYLIDLITAGITLLDVLSDIRDVLTSGVALVQHPGLIHVEYKVENLTNGIDIEIEAAAYAGQDSAGGPVLPNYVAGSYRLLVEGKVTRQGGKRIAGIGETRVSENNYAPDSTAQAALLAALSVIIPITGTVSGSGDATPIVVGRDPLGALNLSRFSTVISANASGKISTQTSRKVPLT